MDINTNTTKIAPEDQLGEEPIVMWCNETDCRAEIGSHQPQRNIRQRSHLWYILQPPSITETVHSEIIGTEVNIGAKINISLLCGFN